MLNVHRKQKEVFEAGDGKQFDNENKARDHEFIIQIEKLANTWGMDSQGMISNVGGFLQSYGSEIRELLNDLLEQR